ncbi:MAG: hypothetical protein SFW07_01065 [Gammaproteobacteria bacterium]|nr:hypothetical protein [Gammaproteobacteria bacterium]
MLTEEPQLVQEDKSRSHHLVQNPIFQIREGEQIKHKVLPGYIKIVTVTEANQTRVETLEFSNAEIHDMVLNPEKIIKATEKLTASPLFTAPNMDDQLSRVKPFKALQKKIATAKRNNPEFNKDKRTLETYTSPETEEKVKPYYYQEMLSLINTLLPKGITLTARNRIILSGDVAHKTTLAVELYEPLIADIKLARQYIFPGKLILEYEFNEKKGFWFKRVSSDNTGLLQLFSLIVLAPNQFKNSEKLMEVQANTLINEPAKFISSEKTLLAALHNSSLVKELLGDFHTKTTDPAQMEGDLERNLKFNENIPEEVKPTIAQFYRQSLASLPNYICRTQSEKIAINGSQGKTFLEFLMRDNKIMLQITMIDPRIGVQNPYIQDADQETLIFPGKISFSYSFDESTGFTFAEMSCSNTVLYNLIMNTRILFPNDEDHDDALAENFQKTLTILKKAADEQEKALTTSPEASSRDSLRK